MKVQIGGWRLSGRGEVGNGTLLRVRKHEKRWRDILGWTSSSSSSSSVHAVETDESSSLFAQTGVAHLWTFWTLLMRVTSPTQEMMSSRRVAVRWFFFSPHFWLSCFWLRTQRQSLTTACVTKRMTTTSLCGQKYKLSFIFTRVV